MSTTTKASPVDHTKKPCDVIELDHHPRTWTDPRRFERFLVDRRVDDAVARAGVGFVQAVQPLGDTLPRTWLEPLVASLPEQPTGADLSTSVAAAAWYFDYLDRIRALPGPGVQFCEYDILKDAHVVEEMLRVGFDRARMAHEARDGAADRVKHHDAELAACRAEGVAGEVSWLGGWAKACGEWAVLWMPSGGGPPEVSVVAEPRERAALLPELFLQAFVRASQWGRAPARVAVFSGAQERAMRDFAQAMELELLPLYRLRHTGPLRFWGQEVVLG